MNAATTRMMEFLKHQIELADAEIRNARVKYETVVSLKSSFETIIADQERIEEQTLTREAK